VRRAVTTECVPNHTVINRNTEMIMHCAVIALTHHEGMWGSRYVASRILNFGAISPYVGQRHAPAALLPPEHQSPVPTEYESGEECPVAVLEISLTLRIIFIGATS
jgi:hypothetical protein